MYLTDYYQSFVLGYALHYCPFAEDYQGNNKGTSRYLIFYVRLDEKNQKKLSPLITLKGALN